MVFKRISIESRWFPMPGGRSRSIPGWIGRSRGSWNYRFPLDPFCFQQCKKFRHEERYDFYDTLAYRPLRNHRKNAIFIRKWGMYHVFWGSPCQTRGKISIFIEKPQFLSRIITSPGQGPGTIIILERSIESDVKNLAETRVLARASLFYIGFGAKKRAN